MGTALVAVVGRSDHAHADPERSCSRRDSAESAAGVEKKPEELETEGSLVIPWATTDNGECLYWLVLPGVEPNEWTIMVNEASGPLWEHYSVSCTQFLASALSAELQSNILSSLFPLAAHEFRRLGAV
ncbi:hypothetical protein ACGFZK_07530 [Streptomyces sp. NPDC048257]|uniref:hypothetical protein n=1 Tax=Streptomyces sp. NPDC048257 TaxID=3365526 RepID=UPI0037130AA8